MAYTVFESTNMLSTHYAKRIRDAVCTQDVENGTFGYLEGTGVIKNFVIGFKAGEEIMVVDQPAWDEEMVNAGRTALKRRDKFIVKAGVPFRVRPVALGEKFAISIDGITVATQAEMEKFGTAAVGGGTVNVYLTIDAVAGKLVASTTSTVGAKFEGVVQEVRMVGGTISTTAHTYGYATKMYVIEVTQLA